MNDLIRDKIQTLKIEATPEAINTLADIALALLERIQNLERRQSAQRVHDWQPTNKWFTCRHCGEEAPAPHAGAPDVGSCPGKQS